MKKIEVENPDAVVETFEPKDYFNYVKGQLTLADEKEFKSQLKVIKEAIIKAHTIGQTSLLHRLVFTHDAIVNEQALLNNGFNKYVLKSDLQKFLTKVKPKNSVKIIELERYPRPIPSANMDAIIRAKELNLFTDFFVVFTDFTEQDYKTEEDKAVVSRNRDPVIFGWFKKDNTTLKHERCYFVTDWEDEYCDLTFTKLITEMSKTTRNPEKTLTKGDMSLAEDVDEAALTEILQQVNKVIDTPVREYARLVAETSNVEEEPVVIENKKWDFFGWFKKKNV